MEAPPTARIHLLVKAAPSRRMHGMERVIFLVKGIMLCERPLRLVTARARAQDLTCRTLLVIRHMAIVLL